MNDSYFLSPFVRVTHLEKGYLLKSLISTEKTHFIKSFSEVTPSNTNMIGDVFVLMADKEKFIKSSFDKLEKLFTKQKNSVGYLETTSVCPYKCQICPKSTTPQIRLKSNLDFEDLKKILVEMSRNGVTSVTFHVFGDPFYDKDIYNKILLANSMGIVPSFSTNLVSLLRIDMSMLVGLKIGNLTISIDSYDDRILSEIRGKVSKKPLIKQ